MYFITSESKIVKNCTRKNMRIPLRFTNRRMCLSMCVCLMNVIHWIYKIRIHFLSVEMKMYIECTSAYFMNVNFLSLVYKCSYPLGGSWVVGWMNDDGWVESIDSNIIWFYFFHSFCFYAITTQEIHKRTQICESRFPLRFAVRIVTSETAVFDANKHTKPQYNNNWRINKFRFCAYFLLLWLLARLLLLLLFSTSKHYKSPDNYLKSTQIRSHNIIIIGTRKMDGTEW